MATQQQQAADVVIVGGGIAGSALATVLARDGLAVTVLEQQRAYADRVRGEYMAEWGVAIAQRLGVFEALAQAGGSIARWAVNYDELIPPEVAEQNRMDISTLIPGVPGVLCQHHPLACETLNQLAASAGARTLRGVEDVRVQTGAQPSVSFRVDGQETTINCRLVVGADGRNSVVRQQAGIPLQRANATNVIAGLLVEGATEWPEDTMALGTEGDRMFLIFPQGRGRARLYLVFSPDQRERFAGPEGAARFLEAFRLQSVPGSTSLASAQPVGPCATWGGEDTWTDEPFAPGVVLIGDAAGYNGPIIGQGLSLALRDVELVQQALREHAEWSPAAFQAYAEDRAERMRRVRFTAGLHADLYATFGPEAMQRRGGFYGRMASGQDPTLQWQMAEPLVGPYNLPEQAFQDSYRANVLGLAEPQPAGAA